MSTDVSDLRRKKLLSAQIAAGVVWPLGRTNAPDEMNTSYGPGIDAKRWDFHDGTWRLDS